MNSYIKTFAIPIISKIRFKLRESKQQILVKMNVVKNSHC